MDDRLAGADADGREKKGCRRAEEVCPMPFLHCRLHAEQI